MGATSTRLSEVSPATALARIHEAEEKMVLELAAVREAITEIETALITPPSNVNLLTVVETARELRVSRSRVFELLAAGELEGIRIGRARCVPRRSIEDFLARLGAA
jgi:excisionase family DNA binding protein